MRMLKAEGRNVRRPTAISNPHLNAELAAARGKVSLLADYFRMQQNPNSEVIKAISHHLDGSDDWQITLTTRTGRHPARALHTDLVWAIGQERMLSSRLAIST